MEMSKVCKHCFYFDWNSSKCSKLSENVSVKTNDVIGYMEDGTLSDNIRESLEVDVILEDLADSPNGLVAKTKVQAVVQAIKDYLEDNESLMVEKIDASISRGLINNCCDDEVQLVITNPSEFGCKYFW